MTATSAIAFLDTSMIRRALPPAAAVEAIAEALRTGLDPANDVARSAVPLAHGELLLMPAQSAAYAGIKVATVAPANPGRGLPRINAVYVLFDAATLQPTALLDGVALTTLRTPAVSVAAVRPFLLRSQSPLRLVVFGAGPQGIGHIETIASLHELASIDVVVRTPATARLPRLVDVPAICLLAAGTVQADLALQQANVVVCATTARQPLFDSNLLAEDTVVVAVGSHEPSAREVDAAFCARAMVIVEDVATALRESGDVIQAVREGALSSDRLFPMHEVVRGKAPPPDGPVFYKGSGMSWEDLVVAEAIIAAMRERGTSS